MNDSTWMVEQITVQDTVQTILSVKLAESKAVVTVAMYARGVGWMPSAFSLLTRLALNLTWMPIPWPLSPEDELRLPKDVMVCIPPAECKPCCTDKAVLDACLRFDAYINPMTTRK